MTPRRALVREPGNSYRHCISCHPLRHTIDVELAREQHAVYRKTLSELGLEVIPLPKDDLHPDSCFIEDTAVIHAGKAMISRMAREERRGEEGPIEAALKEYLKLKRTIAPATLEGGDVIHIPDGLISGITQRTNREAIKQMNNWFGISVRTIEDLSIMHLKSHVTYVGRQMMVATKRYVCHPALKGYMTLAVPDDEAYAANTLTIGGTVLLPKKRTKIQKIIKSAGFDLVTLDTSEFEKCDGALTCLSLLF